MASGNESINNVIASAGVACFQFLGDAQSPLKEAGRRIYGIGREKLMQEYYEEFTNLQKACKQGNENVTKADNSLNRSKKTLETRRKEAARLTESYSLKDKQSKTCTDEKAAEKLARELRSLHKELTNSEAKRQEMDRQVVREEEAAAEARSRLKTDNDELKAKEDQLRNTVNLVVNDFIVGACANYDNSESTKADGVVGVRAPITVGTILDVDCFNRAMQYSKVLPGKSTDDILDQVTGDDKEKVSDFLYRRSMLAELESDTKDQEALQSLLAELKKHAGWSVAWLTVENREKQLAARRAAEAEKQRLAALNTPSARMKRACVDLKRKSIETKDNTIVVLRDPQFQNYTVATAGGAITFGAAGGAFGLASGVVVGSAVGVVPALFTFGLSIPVGGAIGGGCGLCTGTLVGGTTGGVGGFSLYKYRIQIKDGVMTVKVKVEDVVNTANTKATKALEDANVAVTTFRADVSALANKGKVKSLDAIERVKTKASGAYTFATTTKVGVTSTSAAAGAVVGGTGGAACGTVIGAAVGIVPAIFTFGLSIPVGAAIGCCAGTTVGGSAGAIGGGLAGYTKFTHGKAIKEGVKSSWNNASTRVENLKFKTIVKASQAGESVKSMVPFRRGHTGGTVAPSETSE